MTTADLDAILSAAVWVGFVGGMCGGVIVAFVLAWLQSRLDAEDEADRALYGTQS